VGSTKVNWVDGTIGDRELKVPESEPTGTFEPCRYLDGKPCYYDGSSLNAERIFDVLTAEGDEGVWRELEAYYHATFQAIQ
jgi:hypothetical protein